METSLPRRLTAITRQCIPVSLPRCAGRREPWFLIKSLGALEKKKRKNRKCRRRPDSEIYKQAVGGVGRRMKSVGYDARSPPRIIRASNLLGYNYVQISPVFPARDRFSIFDSGSTRPRDGRVRPHGEIALQIVDARSPSTHRDIGRSIDYGSPATIHQEARVHVHVLLRILPPFRGRWSS